MAVSVASPTDGDLVTETTTIDPEDEELISQLAKLQQMHYQIHHLRTLLPTALIGPARAALSQQDRTSPQHVAEAVIKAARQGSADIREFQKSWHDEKTRQLFKDVNAADIPQGIDSWMVDYEQLLKSGPVITSQPSEDSSKDEAFDTDEQAREALQHVIEDKSSHIGLASGSDVGKFPVTVSLGKMKFLINTDQAPKTYTIEAASTHQLAQEISTRLNKNGDSGSGVWKKLDVLLNILKAYHNAEITKCAKCNSIVDDNLDFALVRLPEVAKNAEGESVTKWIAYHDTCSAK